MSFIGRIGKALLGGLTGSLMGPVGTVIGAATGFFSKEVGSAAKEVMGGDKANPQRGRRSLRGGLVGAALGFFTGGPIGAVLGGVIGAGIGGVTARGDNHHRCGNQGHAHQHYGHGNEGCWQGYGGYGHGSYGQPFPGNMGVANIGGYPTPYISPGGGGFYGGGYGYGQCTCHTSGIYQGAASYW